MRKSLIVMAFMALTIGASWGEIERISLADFFLKANVFADREEPDYLLTNLQITDQIDVTKNAQLDGKYLQTFFPIGSTLLVLHALDMPERAPYIYHILFSKEQFKVFQRENDGFFLRYAAFSGLKYKNFAVKTIIPGIMNNFWVFVPTEKFRWWHADKFGDNEYQEPVESVNP